MANRIDIADFEDDPKVTVSLGEMITTGVSMAVMSGADPRDVRRIFRRMAENDEFWEMVGRVRPVSERLADEVVRDVRTEDEPPPGFLS